MEGLHHLCMAMHGHPNPFQSPPSNPNLSSLVNPPFLQPYPTHFTPITPIIRLISAWPCMATQTLLKAINPHSVPMHPMATLATTIQPTHAPHSSPMQPAPHHMLTNGLHTTTMQPAPHPYNSPIQSAPHHM